MGIRRELELTEEEATLQIRSDRGKFLPWGVRGGGPGSRTVNILNPQTENEVLPGKFIRTFKRGDVYRLTQAGAGGYGDPLEREPDAVLADVMQEKVSLERAREVYGVIITPETMAVDQDATEKLRSQMRQKRGPLAQDPEVVRAPSSDTPPPG